jgi:hypothetical protein
MLWLKGLRRERDRQGRNADSNYLKSYGRGLLEGSIAVFICRQQTSARKPTGTESQSKREVAPIDGKTTPGFTPFARAGTAFTPPYRLAGTKATNEGNLAETTWICAKNATEVALLLQTGSLTRETSGTDCTPVIFQCQV